MCPQESGRYEGFRSAASAESNIAALQKLLDAKDKELTRQHVEFNSERKRLEKVGLSDVLIMAWGLQKCKMRKGGRWCH